MKRILFMALVTATVFVGCKKEKDKPEPAGQTTLDTDCTFFDDLGNLSTEERIEWLKGKQGDICETYLNCIAESHQLDSIQIQDVEGQMGSTTVKTFTLGQILIESDCNYDKYIAFPVDSLGNISMDTNSGFNTVDSCYSRPLFYGLKKAHNLTDLTQFHFFEATLTGVTGKTVVFKIDGIANAYFDYSRWPAVIPGKNPL